MSAPAEFQHKVILLGIKIDDRPMDYILDRIDAQLNTESQMKIYTPNPEICLRAENDDFYRHVLNTADINAPDGFGLKLGAMILGQDLENRVAGSDLTPQILEKLRSNGLKVFVVLREDSLSTPNNIADLMKDKYPNVKCKVGIMKSSDFENCDKLLNTINDFDPQILFVCLGAPTQELWINKYIKLLSNVKVAIGVGGSFDFLTGKIKRAPKIMRELGIEWLYRLYQEPKRLERIKHATADFLLACHRWNTRIKNELRVNALAVIRNREGKILIQRNKRFANHWQFPQGGVEKWESVAEAAKREASEEIGAPISAFGATTVLSEKNEYVPPRYSQLLIGYKGQSQTAVLIEFVGNEKDVDVANSEEAEEVKWVNKDELLTYLHRDRQKFAQVLLKYL